MGDRTVQSALDLAWREHRRRVLEVAFRMLGDLGEAEDVAQEAFVRLDRAGVDTVDDPGGWLVVVASRLCLDRLRARRRRPAEVRADLDDGLLAVAADGAPTPADPADRVTLDATVDLAMHLVLERLSPAERTAFVLHDVFQHPFDEVAEIVGRTSAACRQLASRARRALRDEARAGRFSVETAEQRRVTERFIAACSTGDLAGLVAVLDAEVDGWGDVGGPLRVGAEPVAARTMGYLGPPASPVLLSFPLAGRAGVLALVDGEVAAILRLTVEEDRITHMEVYASDRARRAARSALGAAAR